MAKGKIRSIEKLSKAYPVDTPLYFKLKKDEDDALPGTTVVGFQYIYGKANVMGYTYLPSGDAALILQRAFGFSFVVHLDQLCSKSEYDNWHAEVSRQL